MAQTHYRELRLRTPDGPVSAELVARARKAVGIAEQHRAFQDLRHFRRLFTYPDGVTIEALWDGTLWIATIRGQRPAVIEPVRIPRPPIWVPRGFVVLPASDARPAGWGLPVTPAPDTEGPFDPANLVPGLDVARWNPSGPLGEVLLTRLPDAGYPGVGPGAITVPLLWHREYGPQPPQDDDGRWLLNLPPLNPTWSAHRISFEAYRAQQPGLTPEQAAAIAAEKRALFERINLFRETAGRLPLTPPVRGYADTAQASADQAAAAQVLGAWAAAYDPTWRIEGDRLARDGISSRAAAGDDRNATANGVQVQTARTTAAPTSIGTDPAGQPILDIAGGGPPITGEQAADDFEASGYAAAQPGSGSALNVGIRDNVAVAHVVRREAWIETGNRQWISSDPAIPMLSWWGAAGLNLADETYPRTGTTPPVGFDPEDQALEFSLWDPHTLNRSSLYDLDGFCYLRHVYSDPHLPPEAWRVQPFWEGRIFCRGRCIAIAPNNGLVWAAAIRRTTAGGYQLVALVHDPDDEPANLAQARSEGLTRWVRLWRCDLPDVEGLVANPEVCIRGVRGATPAWPWDDPDDPYAWTDGQAIDVGTSDGATRDLLVLASQWTFAPDGNSAACARTWGRYPEAWRTERSPFGLARYADNETVVFPYNSFGLGLVFDHTPRAGVLRLTLTDSSATRTWDGFPIDAVPQYAAPAAPIPRSSRNVVPRVGPWAGLDMVSDVFAIQVYADLLAVDFATDGAGLRYALITLPVGLVLDFDYSANYHVYAVAFTSDLAAAVGDWAPTAIEYGQVAVKPGREHLGVVVANAGVLVLGCADQAMVSIGTVPRFLREEFLPGSPCTPNPAYVTCWADEPELPWFAVNAWVGGQRVLSRWHPNPDRVQINNLYLCHDDWANGDPQVQLLMRTIIRPHFARADGAWLLAYTVQPQDGNRAVVSVAGDCPEFFSGAIGIIYQSACTPRFSDLGTLAHGEHRVAGAGAAASFANEDTLMTLMQIPGQGRRLLHVGAA